ncbi:hypothetical protein ACYTOM_004347 [Salmonella enterica]|nr:hypothetical protein [Salmonella enterica subsp. enterica serovar Thompson]
MLASFDINNLMQEANNLARDIEVRAEAIRMLYLTDPEAAKTAFKALEDQYGDILGTLESRILK